MLKATPQEVDSPVPSTSEPASGNQTPPVAKVNGSDSATSSTPGSAEKDKGDRGRERSEKHKPKRRDRKDHDRDRADKDTARDADAEGGSGEKEDDAEGTTTSPPKPELDTSGSPAPGSDAGPQSPRTDSTGVHTPTSRKPNRNPWMLFVRFPNTANETELRDFFGEAKGGIVRVSFASPLNGRERKFAYVEFGDEQAMKAGLDKHEEELNGGKPEVKLSERDPPREHYHYRGRGGRGGPRGGAFARRGFASAGLVREGAAPKTNGDT